MLQIPSGEYATPWIVPLGVRLTI